jgi:hypothetical protein
MHASRASLPTASGSSVHVDAAKPVRVPVLRHFLTYDMTDIAWLPDGSHIAFVRGKYAGSGDWDARHLWILNLIEHDRAARADTNIRNLRRAAHRSRQHRRTVRRVARDQGNLGRALSRQRIARREKAPNRWLGLRRHLCDLRWQRQRPARPPTHPAWTVRAARRTSGPRGVSTDGPRVRPQAHPVRVRLVERPVPAQPRQHAKREGWRVTPSCQCSSAQLTPGSPTEMHAPQGRVVNVRRRRDSGGGVVARSQAPVAVGTEGEQLAERRKLRPARGARADVVHPGAGGHRCRTARSVAGRGRAPVGVAAARVGPRTRRCSAQSPSWTARWGQPGTPQTDAARGILLAAHFRA